MAISNLLDLLPDYAADVKANMLALLEEDTLTTEELYGTLMATALAARNVTVIREIEDECKKHLDAKTLEAAKGAHAIMAQNNLYFKFYGMVKDDDYRKMKAGLQMDIVRTPPVDKPVFELWSLAVSIINGCKYCVDVHDHQLQRGGISKETIWTTVRITAVVHALATTIGGEEALA